MANLVGVVFWFELGFSRNWIGASADHPIQFQRKPNPTPKSTPTSSEYRASNRGTHSEKPNHHIQVHWAITVNLGEVVWFVGMCGLREITN